MTKYWQHIKQSHSYILDTYYYFIISYLNITLEHFIMFVMVHFDLPFDIDEHSCF